MKSTPGPWAVEQNTSDSGFTFTLITHDHGKGVIAEMPFLGSEDLPNAHLIAEAPNLLMGLEDLCDAVLTMSLDELRIKIINAKALCRRARGET